MTNPFRRRTLDSLKHEARRWLAAIRAGDADAQARLHRALPSVLDASTLRDVQLALAREHGFEGWAALKRALAPDAAVSAATLTRYDAMAAALLEAYRTGTPEAMERHYGYTWHRRAWPGMRTSVQLDLGKRPGGPGDDVPITLDDAMRDVARLRRVQRLNLAGTSITDAGVAHLRACEALREVDLSWTRTGDDAIRALAGKADLHTLRSGLLVTDAGLALFLSGRGITAAVRWAFPSTVAVHREP